MEETLVCSENITTGQLQVTRPHTPGLLCFHTGLSLNNTYIYIQRTIPDFFNNTYWKRSVYNRFPFAYREYTSIKILVIKRR